MIYKMHITFVSFEDNEVDNYKMIALADDPDNPSDYLIIQRAISFEDQDFELGMDGHYFELNGRELSGYKICEKAVLSDGQLKLILHPERKKFPSEVILDLRDADLDIENLRELLTFILDGAVEVL